MDPTLPWYKSAIVRQQAVQIIVAATALLGVNLGDFDVDATLVSIFAGIAGAVGVWTLITRLFKPAPNLTATAKSEEKRLVALGKIPKQGGFARIGSLLVLAAAAFVAVVALSGCPGTLSAYREAKGSMPDTAYVVTEHYAAVLAEAADIAALPGTPQSVKDVLKRADQAVKPFIIGDPTTTPPLRGLQALSDAYQAVRDAKTEAELQASINDAVVELTNFSKAVKSARSTP